MSIRWDNPVCSRVLWTVSSIIGLCTNLTAQSVPIGTSADVTLRLLQLTGQTTNDAGLATRPLHQLQIQSSFDSALMSAVRTPRYLQRGKHLSFGLLPLSLTQQLVSRHPFPQNDGALIPAKGYQHLLSAGVFGTAGPFSFQLKPEWVRSGNPRYVTTPNFGSKPLGNYNKVFPGQSYIRAAAGPVALSLSSENMWWGPGIHHALLMSNQAPGFLHLKLHSTRPVSTPIGKFEWALLGGRLTSDTVIPFENEYYQNGGFALPRRYLNAYVFTYQPKWLNGLTLGMARTLQRRQQDVDSTDAGVLRKYLPVLFKPLNKRTDLTDDQEMTDQLGSAFFRWLFRRSHAELYGEFGYNDYKANSRDLVLNLPHAAAYLVGFRKAFALKDSAWLEAGIEVLRLSQSADRNVRNAGNWYIHAIVDGHTYQNQVMGAVFASNAQTLQLARQKGMIRSSLRLQRFQRDPDRFVRRWNDYVVVLNHTRPAFNSLVADGQLSFNYAHHYGWELSQKPLQVIARLALHYYF